MHRRDESIDSTSADHARMYFLWDEKKIFSYMAPEIWENREYDGRSADIWSVAVSLLVCLVGEEQWKAPTRVPLESHEIYRYVCMRVGRFLLNGSWCHIVGHW